MYYLYIPKFSLVDRLLELTKIERNNSNMGENYLILQFIGLAAQVVAWRSQLANHSQIGATVIIAVNTVTPGSDFEWYCILFKYNKINQSTDKVALPPSLRLTPILCFYNIVITPSSDCTYMYGIIMYVLIWMVLYIVQT